MVGSGPVGPLDRTGTAPYPADRSRAYFYPNRQPDHNSNGHAYGNRHANAPADGYPLAHPNTVTPHRHPPPANKQTAATPSNCHLPSHRHPSPHLSV